MPKTIDPELQYEAESPAWSAMQVLSEKVGKNLLLGGHNLLFNLSNWLLAVDLFKEFEEARLVLREAKSSDQDFHRVTLTQLLSSGEKLAQELAANPGANPIHIGLTLTDVNATLDNLRLTYSEYYGGMTAARKSEILKGVFGVQT